MRRSVLLAMTAVLAVSAGVSASAREPAAAPAQTTPPPTDSSGRVITTDEANRSGVQGVVEAPLRDFNVVRTKIPSVLLDALADPYNRPSLGSKGSRKGQCAQLIELIKPLNAAMGPDLDSPEANTSGLVDRGRGAAMGLAASFASDAIPFHSWVRKLSGAEAHDQQVQAAIVAGAVRRAYLKGLGEARGCNPPATPSHVLTKAAPPPASQPKPAPAHKPQPHKSGLKPRYPTK